MRQGVVHLRGVVASITDAEVAEEVAGRVPNVDEVIEELEVAGLISGSVSYFTIDQSPLPSTSSRTPSIARVHALPQTFSEIFATVLLSFAA